jgi:hypothetical protein
MSNKNIRTRTIVIMVVTVLSLLAMFGPWNRIPGSLLPLPLLRAGSNRT